MAMCAKINLKLTELHINNARCDPSYHLLNSLVLNKVSHEEVRSIWLVDIVVDSPLKCNVIIFMVHEQLNI